MLAWSHTNQSSMRVPIQGLHVKTGPMLTRRQWRPPPRNCALQPSGELHVPPGHGILIRRHTRRPTVLIAASAASHPEGSQSSGSSSPVEFPPGFISRRLIVFAGILLGYTVLYVMRGTLTFTAPVMVADPSLGLTKTDIGTMTSLFPMAYGLSKFYGGVLMAGLSARWVLACALLSTGFINILFGFNTSLFWWCALWAMNGGIQGVGAPACATILTRWFAAKERGTYWGLWNIGTNLGGFMAPVLVGYMAKTFGWQWGMWAPGILGAVAGLAVLAMTRDRPEEAGFPPVEAKGKKQEAGAKGSKEKDAAKDIKDSMAEVLRNPGVWLLAITYFFVYMVRQGSTSWLVFYLMEMKGATDAAMATLRVSGLELGGLAGGLLSGVLSDWFIKGAKKGDGLVGKRVQVVMLYTAATLGVLLALWAVPASAGMAQWLTIAALGFCIYGPQMLIGLCGAELVSPKAVGASQGLLGLISYAGAANAGVPLALLQKSMGWDGYFYAMAGACVVSLVLLIPLMNSKSQAQKAEAALV